MKHPAVQPWSAARNRLTAAVKRPLSIRAMDLHRFKQEEEFLFLLFSFSLTGAPFSAII